MLVLAVRLHTVNLETNQIKIKKTRGNQVRKSAQQLTSGYHHMGNCVEKQESLYIIPPLPLPSSPTIHRVPNRHTWVLGLWSPLVMQVRGKIRIPPHQTTIRIHASLISGDKGSNPVWQQVTNQHCDLFYLWWLEMHRQRLFGRISMANFKKLHQPIPIRFLICNQAAWRSASGW